MEKTVKIKVKSVCGAERAYGEGEASDQFMRLIRPRKTFDDTDLDAIQELGFELDVERIPIKRLGQE